MELKVLQKMFNVDNKFKGYKSVTGRGNKKTQYFINKKKSHNA